MTTSSVSTKVDYVEAVRLYVEEGLSQRGVARRISCDPRAVRRALQTHGIEIRNENARIDDAEVVRLYVKGGLSQSQVADHLGCGMGSVHRALVRRGVKARPQGEHSKIPLEEIKRLYLEEERSYAEIAGIYGVVPHAIFGRLKRAGVPMRTSSRGTFTLTRDQLRTLRVVEGLTWSEIGQSIGVSPSTVRGYAHRWGLSSPSPKSLELTREDMMRLYKREGLNTHQIARRYGVHYATANRHAKRVGVPDAVRRKYKRPALIEAPEVIARRLDVPRECLVEVRQNPEAAMYSMIGQEVVCNSQAYDTGIRGRHMVIVGEDYREERTLYYAKLKGPTSPNKREITYALWDDEIRMVSRKRCA